MAHNDEAPAVRTKRVYKLVDTIRSRLFVGSSVLGADVVVQTG